LLCTNCRRPYVELLEVWNDGYGNQRPTGRHWCSPSCRDATVLMVDAGVRRFSLSDVLASEFAPRAN
jgi:hypothetical protein